MPHSLDELSVELITRIADHMESSECLVNLACLSSRYHQIALPLLYGYINLRYEEDFDSDDFMDEYLDGEPPLFHHLRSLTELFLYRPEYARLTRRFTMRTIFPTVPSADDGGGSPLGVEVPDIIQNAIKIASQSREEEEDWLRDAAGKSKDDAIVALLIPTMLRLEKLDIMLGYGGRYVERMFLRAAYGGNQFEETPGLRNLIQTATTWYNDEHGMPPWHIAPYFALPSIRRIFVLFMGSKQEEYMLDGGLARREAGSSAVTHLELKNCKLNTADLLQILGVPKALDTFIYEVGQGKLALCRFSTTAVRYALEHQARSLENLWLDYANNTVEWFAGFDDLAPMASFKNFSRLKRLRIASGFLFGMSFEINDAVATSLTHTFPATLEELHITRCEDRFDILQIALEELILYKDRTVPSLQRIILEGPFTMEEELWERIPRLLRLAAAARIQMTTLDNHSGPPPDVDVEERAWGMDGEFPWEEGYDNLNKRPVSNVVHFRIEEL